jgi:hypothetical protein
MGKRNSLRATTESFWPASAQGDHALQSLSVENDDQAHPRHDGAGRTEQQKCVQNTPAIIRLGINPR